MARKKSSSSRTDSSHDLMPSPHLAAWVALTWNDIQLAFESGSVQRGRAYQRDGHVSEILVSQEGELLGAVQGTHLYVTNVKLLPKKQGPDRFEATCSCPMGGRCKHAVAVVADYLAQLADGKSPPVVSSDDVRWKRLQKIRHSSDEEADEDDEDFEDDDVDEDDVDDEDDDDRKTQSVRGTRSSNRNSQRGESLPTTAKKSGRRTRAEWDALILADLKKKSVDELAGLVASLIDRFPDLRQEFQERLWLSQSDASKLIREARKELRSVTLEIGRQSQWNDDGHTPSYDRLKKRLERLVELGQLDVVVEMGRELFENGMMQVEESRDEGETAEELATCFPVVFAAVAASSLTPTEKILYAIDACELDDWSYIAPNAAVILEFSWSKDDWSSVADRLAERLYPTATRGTMKDRGDEKADSGGGESPYQRNSLSDWLAKALERAGRSDEILPLYVTEVSYTGSYKRLVDYLIKLKLFDDADRWAREGILKTRDQGVGTTSFLADALVKLAEAREQWDIVAAKAACIFFSRPSVQSFQELMKAAKKAKCEATVRRRAEQFLETGIAPIRCHRVKVPMLQSDDGLRTALGKNLAINRSATDDLSPTMLPEPPTLQYTCEEGWPLPVPDYLAAAYLSENPLVSGEKGNPQVLLELAIAEERHVDVLRWYDSMTNRIPLQSGNSIHRMHAFHDSLDGRVAVAVADSHPERALGIYRRDLERHLPDATLLAYERCASNLRKMHPILKKVGREREWFDLVQTIREKYRTRRRFMEVLDTIDPRPIIETQKGGK